MPGPRASHALSLAPLASPGREHIRVFAPGFESGVGFSWMTKGDQGEEDARSRRAR